MKIAILNDTHAGARNSSEIFLDYFGKFYSEVFFPYCDQHGIKQIIHLGDFYDHRKFINFKALYHNRKTFLEPMRERGMTMDIIPGNHDVVYKNTNDLCSLKELLGFFVKDVNIILKPTVMQYGACRIAMLPWINPENYESSLRFLESCDAPILGAHLEVNGFDVMPGMPSSHGLDPELFHRFESVWSGHYHSKQQKGNIHYLGTQFEMNWSDCNEAKYFHVFDTETRELTAVRNPHTIFARMSYDDRDPSIPDRVDPTQFKNKFVKIVVVNKSDFFEFDRFIDLVQKQGVLEMKIAENFDEFLGENVENETLEKTTETSELLDNYVDAADTELNKDLIKTRLRELYIEAQNFEVV